MIGMRKPFKHASSRSTFLIASISEHSLKIFSKDVLESCLGVRSDWPRIMLERHFLSMTLIGIWFPPTLNFLFYSPMVGEVIQRIIFMILSLFLSYTVYLIPFSVQLSPFSDKELHENNCEIRNLGAFFLFE